DECREATDHGEEARREHTANPEEEVGELRTPRRGSPRDRRPMEPFAGDRLPELGEVAAVDDEERNPRAGDDASANRVEDDCGPRSIVALAREVDELSVRHNLEATCGPVH